VGTYVVSGSASGMGLATAGRLRELGHEVIGIDVRDADVVADLSDRQGREDALSQVGALCRGRLDGAALFAGLVGLTGRASHLLAAVNYFGSVRLLDGLRPYLAAAGTSYAVAVCSNSMTCQPGLDEELVEALLAGEESHACEVADRGPAVMAYPATKTALARWVRRHAPTAEWIGSGIRLNAIAPGVVETAMVAETRSDPVLAPLIEGFSVPIGRGARAEELAELAVFMLTKASFMVGSIVLADGGTEAQLRPDVYPTPWRP
jgi:NAD(P)-dependent dehydrogenase (short-subunit alcohol dehydrogenase family)